MRGQPQLGLRCFISTTASMSSALGPFGPGFRRRFGENRTRYFCLLKALSRPSSVEGFRTIAEFMRLGPHPRRLDGALGTSHSLAPFRNRSEAFDAAWLSQSLEQAKVPR